MLAISIQHFLRTTIKQAGLAQSVERQALNLMVEGSSPSFGATFIRRENFTVFVFTVFYDYFRFSSYGIFLRNTLIVHPMQFVSLNTTLSNYLFSLKFTYTPNFTTFSTFSLPQPQALVSMSSLLASTSCPHVPPEFVMITFHIRSCPVSAENILNYLKLFFKKNLCPVRFIVFHRIEIQKNDE